MRKNVLLLSLAFVFVTMVNNASAQKIFALTETNQFYWFDASNPSMMSTPVAVTGMASGIELVGMDVRPATGEVYLLGYNSTIQMAQVYKLDTATKGLTAIGAGITPFVLSGRVGFDFNPTVDRIRVTSSNEHDYRLHPVTGALVATDGILAYSGTDVHAGINPNIGASAYTNSYIGSTSTALYNYDDSLNVITLQNPPNNGVQNTVGVSGIMVNWANPSSDLDIYFNPSTLQNVAYLVANTGALTNDSLYLINLSTGGATAVASLNMAVKDIAVMINRTAPSNMNGKEMMALASNNTIIKFNSSNPSYITSATAVTGLIGGQTLVGMDMRPADMKVYAVGYNATTMVARIYTLDATTLLATPVSTDSISNIDLTGNVGVDFNPVADRIRVVTSKGRNYRLNQLTGALAANDTNLAYKAGDINFGVKPNVASVAYTNSKAGTTSTLLYVYDDSLNVLATQNPPNAGVLNTIGMSGITVNGADRTSDLDIYYDHLSQSDIAYLSANAGSTTSDKLYHVNLSNGQVMDMGMIGYGISVLDIVVKQDMAPAPVIANQLIHALTANNELVTFNASNPSATLSAPAAITGVGSGYEIMGMDIRPATGELYILTYNATAQMGLLYKVDTASKAATAVGTGIPSFALSGKVGFDFNPTVDRIRVVSSDRHDYRLHPVTGGLAATDGMLVYAPTDVNSGIKPNIGTAAYTNSYIGSTSTVLYNYDDSLNVLTTQNPPNNGVQNTIGVSGIKVNLADASSDLDIYFNPVSMQNEAYFVANPASAGNDILYMMNLSTGMVSFIGNIGVAVKDIAIPVNRVAPAPSGKMVYALTSNNNIVSFRSGTPSYILSQATVSGVAAGQTLVGMDVRPADLKIYAVGYNPATMVARIYTLDPLTAVATPVSTDSITGIDLGGNVGVDFNPVADRLRVVTSTNKNYRLNQLTGLLAATDTVLFYKTGDANFGVDPDVATVAYSNSKVAPASTVLYAYDDSLNLLLTQDPPNAGLLSTIGTSGIAVNGMDRTSDMDIYFDHTAQTNMAYFTANTTNGNDKFYTLNLTSGMATEVGMIGWGIAVKDIAIQLDSTPPVTAVNKISNEKIASVTAYPNPIGSNLTVSFDLKQAAVVTISVIDITGRKVADLYQGNAFTGSNSVTYNSAALQNGIYFVTVEMEGETQTFKIVK